MFHVRRQQTKSLHTQIFNVHKIPVFPSTSKNAYKSEAEIYNDLTIPPLLQTLEEIKDEFKTSIFLKAVKNDEIIGSVRGTLINSKICYIGRLIVNPNFQNHGIGTRLMREIEEIFNECKRFEL